MFFKATQKLFYRLISICFIECEENLTKWDKDVDKTNFELAEKVVGCKMFYDIKTRDGGSFKSAEQFFVTHNFSKPNFYFNINFGSPGNCS